MTISLRFFCFASLLLTACKSPGNAAVKDELDPSVEDQADTDTSEAAALPTDCGVANPVATTAQTGAQTFDMTARCLFGQKTHELRIRILGETFQKVLDDGCAGRDDGLGHVIELVLDGVRIPDVGIAVRGNTSKCNPKRQFKFKFDAKEAFSILRGVKEVKTFPQNDGRTVFGLESFSVRASANDPSMVREAAATGLFAATDALAPTTVRGPPTYRLGFAKVFVSFNRTIAQGAEGLFNRPIDGVFFKYLGFYSLTENIDKVFLQTRFQQADEKLKSFFLFEADQATASLDKAKFLRKTWSTEFVDGKKVSEANIAAGEAKLFEIFDLFAKPADEATIAAAVDVNSVVNYTAGVILSGHWDSLLANGNNDYLFFNGATKKWQLLIWDLDNSLGAGHDSFVARMAPDIFNTSKLKKSGLFEQMFAPTHPGFRALLKQRLAQATADFAGDAKFGQTINQLREIVRTQAEPSEGFKVQNYEDIKNFVRARRTVTAPQLSP